MTPEAVEPRWNASRWWTFVALVFTLQFALIFWLGSPHRAPIAPNDLAPTLRFVGSVPAQMPSWSDQTLSTLQVLALTDPTLFALPHQESFSGSAWLTVPAQEFRPFVWSEPNHWLTLAQNDLGRDFKTFMSTNQPDILPVLTQPDLQFKIPEIAEYNPFPTQSMLRITGALADRHLLVNPTLPSWPNTEILTNSVVRVVVGADGKPVSQILLKPPGVGPNEADRYALSEARKARFEPLADNNPRNPLAGLDWGLLIFEWRTLPLPDTNSVTALPK